jgi:hypothetical protein
VRCAGCGNTWHQAPDPPETAAPPLISESAELAPDLAAVLEAPRIEPGLEAPPRPIGMGDPAAPALRRFSWVGIGWAAMSVVVVVCVLGGLAARSAVIGMWPASARLYAIVGLAPDTPGSGLEIAKILPKRTADGGIVIEGDVANTGSRARDVPKLRVTLRDSSKKEVQFKIIEPPKDRLLPGEVVHFKTPFEQPNDAATDVAVTFASS